MVTELEDGDIAVIESKETNGKIELDEKTRAMIVQRRLQIQALTTEIELLLNGYMNGKGREGNYRLNEDITALVKQDELKVESDGRIGIGT